MSLPPPPSSGPVQWTDLVPQGGRPRRPGLVAFAGIFLILEGVASLWIGLGVIGFGGRAQLAPESSRILSALAAALVILGLLHVVTGLLIFGQRRLGRTIGEVLAAIGVVSGLLRLGVAPAAGLVSMFLNCLVLYALTVNKDAFGRWG